jgi:arginyl-tRNA synthetase
VVNFYTRFGDDNKIQAQKLAEETGKTVEEVENTTPLMEEAREMLRKWEAGDAETLALWKKLNDWVYEGFEQTYKRIGVEFEKIYYESDTWTEGSRLVDEGLEKGIFYKKDDGSVWFDLGAHGLDDKAVRRSDGTSMYITQDLGTARQKYLDYKMDQSIFVVGNEQDHHFKVLFLMLNALDGFPVEGLFHLSYAMVDLPGGQGRIKTREGTRVDADHLMDEVCGKAMEVTSESQRLEGFSDAEIRDIVEKVGLSALKYYVLKVNPKRRMIFDPVESVDLQGNTGPFIQYAWARTRSVWEKAEETGMAASVSESNAYTGLLPSEKIMLRIMYKFPKALEESAANLDPSMIASLAYDLAKSINSVWHEAKILNEDDLAATGFRLELFRAAREILRQALSMLGIDVPTRM